MAPKMRKKKTQDEDVKTEFKFKFPEDMTKKEKDVHIPTIRIKVRNTEDNAEWTSLGEGKTNRFISRHGLEKLALLSFDVNVTSSIAEKILLQGISINKENYSFLGCSSGGLKERKCYMWKGTSDEVDELLKQEGDFESLPTVSKQLARIGMLFSGVILTGVEVKDEKVVVVDDIVRGVQGQKYNFSDGCGGIGIDVARQLYAKLKGPYDDDGDLPSVYQVRFQGCKGVLAMDNKIEPDQILIRPSMQKFETDRYPEIGVCDYSKPYTFGHLNKQFIMLLSGLGIKDNVLKGKQANHFERLEKMWTDPESAITVLQWQNQFSIAQILAKAGSFKALTAHQMQTVKRTLEKIQEKLVTEKIKDGKMKLSILIPHSRNVFGVCDPSAILDYGECFLRITESGRPKTIRGNVVVCKNPCYLLGDVRVLVAVDETDKPGVSELHHLIDCIVFPINGNRPHSDEIAGSDLDGDKYFVTWDEQLIPTKTRPAHNYTAEPSTCHYPLSNKGKIAYFSRLNGVHKVISRVDDYFNKFADIEGVSSTKCKRLGKLFARAIDAPKSGEVIEIPQDLKPPHIQENNRTHFVWSQMETTASQFKKRFKERMINDKKDVTAEFVMEIVQQQYANISEFQKFMFALNHTRQVLKNDEEVVKYIMQSYIAHINFSMFSLEEKICAMDIGVPPRIVTNALNKSKILCKEDLEYFNMDTAASTWSHFLAKEQDSFDWSHLVKTLTTNDKVLLVLKLQDDVFLALQFLEKQHLGREQMVQPGSISAVLYSKYGAKHRYIVGPTYYLDFTEDTLQLYRERKKPLTFVWMKATDRKLSKKGWDKPLADEVVNSISVDLQRFDRRILRADKPHPRINKLPFISIEMYAQRETGMAPYWDTIDANDLLPVEEMVETEEGKTSEDETEIDFDRLFPMVDIDDEEMNFCEMLRQTENPYIFRAVLQLGRESELREQTGHSFSILLSKIVEKVTPNVLPEALQTVIVETVSTVKRVLNPRCVLSVAGSLCRLHLRNCAKKVVEKEYETSVSIYRVLEVLKDWQSLWFLDTETAITFLSNFRLATLCQGDQQRGPDSVLPYCRVGDSPPVLWKQRYIHNYALLHALSMVAEADNQKKMLGGEETQRCVAHLSLDLEQDRKQDTVLFHLKGALNYSSLISKGMYVAISKQGDLKQHGPRVVCCVGRVANVQADPYQLVVELSETRPTVLTSSSKVKWRLDLIGDIATYTHAISAIECLCDAEHRNGLLNYIIHPAGHAETSTFEGMKLCEKFPAVNGHKEKHKIPYGDLNEDQQAAVLAALENDITLIQGFPGTGKTKVACHIIELIHSMREPSGILVVAETNVAVDILARRLMREDLRIVRIKSGDRIAPDLRECSLDCQMGQLQSIESILSAADVVLATCAGAGNIPLGGNNQFEFVLVEEATQTMETTLLCSLAHGAKHLVMIGDPEAHGPKVPGLSGLSSKEGHPKLEDLPKSLFHRLCSVMPHFLLNKQYRMNPEIMKFPSVAFYNGQLKAAVSVDVPLPIFPWPEEKRPLCFIDVIDEAEIPRGMSFCNKKEANVVQKCVDVLLNVHEDKKEDRISSTDMTVLTLYQGQVKQIESKIRKSKVAVSTVDGFQGHAKDVIIVSTVRSNKEGSLGLTGDKHRINVLLTRAKRGLIVVGNAGTLRASPVWRKWIDQAPRLNIADLNQVGN